MSGLFGKPTSGEGLLHVGGDKDTAFTVLGFRAAVEADAGASGYLDEDGQGALELGGLGDLHFVNECRDEVVGILERVADGMQPLNH